MASIIYNKSYQAMLNYIFFASTRANVMTLFAYLSEKKCLWKVLGMSQETKAPSKAPNIVAFASNGTILMVLSASS